MFLYERADQKFSITLIHDLRISNNLLFEVGSNNFERQLINTKEQGGSEFGAFFVRFSQDFTSDFHGSFHRLEKYTYLFLSIEDGSEEVKYKLHKK